MTRGICPLKVESLNYDKESWTPPSFSDVNEGMGRATLSS